MLAPWSITFPWEASGVPPDDSFLFPKVTFGIGAPHPQFLGIALNQTEDHNFLTRLLPQPNNSSSPSLISLNRSTTRTIKNMRACHSVKL